MINVNVFAHVCKLVITSFSSETIRNSESILQGRIRILQMNEINSDQKEIEIAYGCYQDLFDFGKTLVISNNLDF